MNIGEAAKISGVSAKLIRYYESIGLLPKAPRTASGYRNYSDDEVRRLRFVRRARALNFPIGQIGQLLSLWDDPARASADVKTLAESHSRQLRDRAHQLEEMAEMLDGLAERCPGDGDPECPILEALCHPPAHERERQASAHCQR